MRKGAWEHRSDVNIGTFQPAFTNSNTSTVLSSCVLHQHQHQHEHGSSYVASTVPSARARASIRSIFTSGTRNHASAVNPAEMKINVV